MERDILSSAKKKKLFEEQVLGKQTNNKEICTAKKFRFLSNLAAKGLRELRNYKTKAKNFCDSLSRLVTESIADYFKSNKLIINLKRGKTESMSFKTGKRLSKFDEQLDMSFCGQKKATLLSTLIWGMLLTSLKTAISTKFTKADGHLTLLACYSSILQQNQRSLYSQ